jgi:cytoskeletal protein RodZ
MKELGQWLRETRESMGLSLAEVESEIRIRQKFLAAMEAEDWDVLPGDVPTRGFLRKYAAFLGLNVGEVLGFYQERGAPATAPVTIDEASVERPVDYRPIEVNLAETTAPELPWRPIALVVLVLLIAAGAWWIITYQSGWLSSFNAFLPPSLPDPNSLAASNTPVATPTRIIIRVTATPTDTPEVTPTPESTATPDTPEAEPAVVPGETATTAVTLTATASNFRPVDALQMALQVVQRSWVRVTVDGQVRLENILEPGEEGAWEGRESIVLRTGNGAGVVVTLNEDQLPALGGPGEVVELQWTLVDGAVVQATATPAPSETPLVEGSGNTDQPVPVESPLPEAG